MPALIITNKSNLRKCSQGEARQIGAAVMQVSGGSELFHVGAGEGRLRQRTNNYGCQDETEWMEYKILIKKNLVNIIYLNSKQFCLEFIFEFVNLTPLFGICINKERRLKPVIKVLLNYFIYTFIFATISNDD